MPLRCQSALVLAGILDERWGCVRRGARLQGGGDGGELSSGGCSGRRPPEAPRSAPEPVISPMITTFLPSYLLTLAICLFSRHNLCLRVFGSPVRVSKTCSTPRDTETTWTEATEHEHRPPIDSADARPDGINGPLVETGRTQRFARYRRMLRFCRDRRALPRRRPDSSHQRRDHADALGWALGCGLHG